MTAAFSCAAPAGSAIQARLAGSYFHDCHAIEVEDTGRSALGHFLVAAARTPGWVETLMILRNRLVRLVGLKDLGGLSGIDPTKSASGYAAGDRVGIFTLIENTDAEALLGDDDKHLDVMLSVFKQPSDREGFVRIHVTTVVHIHNLLGRIYMLPVAPMHKLIAPAVTARMAKAKG